MNENAFAKLPKNIEQRSWFTDGNTLKLYVALLIHAAWSEIEYEGFVIKPGQYAASIRRLSEICELTIQQTRTALSHLKATKDITVRPASKFSIITLTDYDCASEGGTLANKPVNTLPNKQINNKVISKEKEKEKEEIKKEAAAAAPSAAADKSSLIKKYGEKLILVYEEKFFRWRAAKGAKVVNAYPVIAKWLKEDGVPEKPQNTGSSSFVISEVERRIREQYKKDIL